MIGSGTAQGCTPRYGRGSVQETRILVPLRRLLIRTNQLNVTISCVFSSSVFENRQFGPPILGQ